MPQPSIKNRIAIYEFIIPLCILIVGTVVCLVTDFDIELSKPYFDESQQKWLGYDAAAIVFFYNWGPLLTAAVAAWGLFYLCASYLHPRFWAKRVVSLFILLSILIGPIIVVNIIVKESWRRPRPRDIIEFGGTHSFRKVLAFGNRDYRGKSFPSGHSSAGFILVLFYFLLKKHHRKASLLALLFAIGWGSWLGYGRIALGGHFFSDNLYAFGINWFVPWFLYYFWLEKYKKKHVNRTPFQKSRNRYMVGASLLIICTFLFSIRFLFSSPFRIDYSDKTMLLPKRKKEYVVKVRVQKGDITIRRGKNHQIHLTTWINGHAFPGIKANRIFKVDESKDLWQLSYDLQPDGFYFEYQSHTAIYVPKDSRIKFDLFTNQGSVMRDDLQDPQQ